MFSLQSVTDVLWTYRTWASVARRAAQPRAGAVDNKHLLLVSWGFPPYFATGIQITASFARDAADRGWRVSVLCCPAKPGAGSAPGVELLRSLPPSVDLVRVPLAENDNSELLIAPSTRVTPLIDGHFVTALAMADLGLRHFAADPPAVVVAFGPRFSNFVAALYLARGFGPRTRLALSYSDEWTIQSQPFVSAGPEDRKWERRCLDRADMVAFATQGKLDAYRAAFPHLSHTPFRILPCGWDPTNYDPTDRVPRPDQARPSPAFVLAFVGRAAPNTPLLPFLSDLEAALKIRPDLALRIIFWLVGRQTLEVQQGVERFQRDHPGILSQHSEVPARRAVTIQRESDALLLLANTPYPGVVPLKLFDYMTSGRPILAYGTTSESASVVASTGSGIVISEGDPAALIRGLDALIQQDSSVWLTQPREAWVKNNRRDRLNAAFLDEIAGLLSEPSRPSSA